jgi:hypothetical protein
MPVRDDIIGNGWRFPLMPDAGGRLAYVGGEANIQQSLKLLLLTNMRERVMRRSFGSKARDLVFAPGSEQGLRLLESSIADAIRNFEPRVELLNVSAISDPREPSHITVDISYQIRATYVRGNLVFPFYLEGTGGGGDQ